MDRHYAPGVSLCHPSVRHLLYHPLFVVSLCAFIGAVAAWHNTHSSFPATLHCLHRYWLWYTTQRCVSGVVRKVYQRLKQFKVQFLVLQRRTDPSQVLLQCLPTNKVGIILFCAATLVFIESGQYYTKKPTTSLWPFLFYWDYNSPIPFDGYPKNCCCGSCTGREQSEVFIRAIWWPPTLWPVWPAGRRAVLRWLWERFRYQHRYKVSVTTSS